MSFYVTGFNCGVCTIHNSRTRVRTHAHKHICERITFCNTFFTSCALSFSRAQVSHPHIWSNIIPRSVSSFQFEQVNGSIIVVSLNGFSLCLGHLNNSFKWHMDIEHEQQAGTKPYRTESRKTEQRNGIEMRIAGKIHTHRSIDHR